jgi:hypothetical protein
LCWDVVVNFLMVMTMYGAGNFIYACSFDESAAKEEETNDLPFESRKWRHQNWYVNKVENQSSRSRSVIKGYISRYIELGDIIKLEKNLKVWRCIDETTRGSRFSIR